MAVLRVVGFLMIGLGILLCLTIIGAAIGIPMMLFGLLFVVAGRKREPIVVHMQAPPHPYAAPHPYAPPQTAIPPQTVLPHQNYTSYAIADNLPSASPQSPANEGST